MIIPTGKITMKGAMDHNWDKLYDGQVDDNVSFMDDPGDQFNFEPLSEYFNVDKDMVEVELTSGIVSAKYPALNYLKIDLYSKW